ncbi:MAG: transketolase [Candidatus Paracaedibacteraceae bacterium]|nr:transketolase [Candidatus Paracaedibacteraceae bacterium]
MTPSSNALRFLSIDAVEKAQSGHPGMPMGMADVATILFQEFLIFSPKDPYWPNRDRFVLSAGHGSILLYSLLHLCGYPEMTMDQIKNFRQWESITPGHPEYAHTPGVETTTGPLGQGIATAVGMALGQEMMAARVGQNIINNKTYVICGDGDLMEGISQEAISFAGHLKLKNLIVLFDDNGITIDGKTSLSTSDNTRLRFEASGWKVKEIDGHDEQAIREALTWAQTTDAPTLIACKTTIGFGSPAKAGTSASHGSPIGTDEIKKTREKLNWPHESFEIPADIHNTWANAAMRHQDTYNAWIEKHDTLSSENKKLLSGAKEIYSKDAFDKIKQVFLNEKPNQATRVLSQRVLDAILPAIPELIGGSADLTGSNNTKVKSQQPISATDFSGSYIYFGIREHAMAAMMNGLSLYGFIPYGGTFLVFSDYLRPSLRLSALMKQKAIYVLTHDSIGLGEDGPTHQPVEHLTALRAIPNLYVFRPADSIETAECWDIALNSKDTPSVLALTRQNLPTLRTNIDTNLSAFGAYVLSDSKTSRQATLLASGSEVALAIEAQSALRDMGINVVVVSVPCMEVFNTQENTYKRSVLGSAPRIAIEAGIEMSWSKYLRENDLFIGMTSFGASAPAPVLYEKFNITKESIINAVKERI